MRLTRLYFHSLCQLFRLNTQLRYTLNGTFPICILNHQGDYIFRILRWQYFQYMDLWLALSFFSIQKTWVLCYGNNPIYATATACRLCGWALSKVRTCWSKRVAGFRVVISLNSLQIPSAYRFQPLMIDMRWKYWLKILKIVMRGDTVYSTSLNKLMSLHSNS